MGTGRRIGRAAAWTLTASLVAAGASARETVAPKTVTIRLDDLAQTPARDLDAAKAELDRIFHEAGIDIVWVEGPAMLAPGSLTLILLNTNAPGAGPGGDVAGEANRQTSRAYVYCNRLEAVSKHLPVNANVILGRVMAHEIGHLLLPPNSHSPVGIMRPHVNFSPVGFNSFTDDEARELRRALER